MSGYNISKYIVIYIYIQVYMHIYIYIYICTYIKNKTIDSLCTQEQNQGMRG